MKIIILLICFLECVCTTNQQKNVSPIKSDSTIYEKNDSFGRVIEKWGNNNKDDDDTNFRFFFFYDENNLLVGEKKYFFDDKNTECIIKDSAIYDFIKYNYRIENKKYILVTEECTIPDYDSSGKYVGRRLYYIQDAITGKYVFEDPRTIKYE